MVDVKVLQESEVMLTEDKAARKLQTALELGESIGLRIHGFNLSSVFLEIAGVEPPA